MTHTHNEESQLVEELEKPRRRWRVLALELVVIFVGITASFWVDEWRGQRQDTETFHRILGEIYYDAILDESTLTGMAAYNNLALRHASGLVLRETDPPSGEELVTQLQIVFDAEGRVSPTLGGYTRLTNTPLAIPVNDVQLDLDYRYGLYVGFHEELAREFDDLRALRAADWASRGVVACQQPGSALGGGVLPQVIEDLDLLGQLEPASGAIRDGGECLTDPFNQTLAEQALRDESFRVALRRIIETRSNIALSLARLRIEAYAIRRLLEGYLPDISLPIETLGIAGSATPVEWDNTNAIPMRRLGANDWELEIELMDGEVKFLANEDWTMNWGAPRPWLGDGTLMSFEAAQVPVDEVFPSGTARFNGVNIPVEAGRYRLRFDTQSGDYRFEPLVE